MLIITADDLGRDVAATNSCLECHRRGKITSASIMVFMKDSERAADLAAREDLETGLHINLVLPYDAPGLRESLRKSQNSTAAFFGKGPWTQVIYNPFIAKAATEAFSSQLEEYRRLFGREPAYYNGHKHFHLSLNMIFGVVMPRGSTVRRSFTFFPGEKTWINRFYRKLIDAWLLNWHLSTDAFFSISPVGDRARLTRIVDLAKRSQIELMTHPWNPEQYVFLTSSEFDRILDGVHLGRFSLINPRQA